MTPDATWCVLPWLNLQGCWSEHWAQVPRPKRPNGTLGLGGNVLFCCCCFFHICYMLSYFVIFFHHELLCSDFYTHPLKCSFKNNSRGNANLWYSRVNNTVQMFHQHGVHGCLQLTWNRQTSLHLIVSASKHQSLALELSLWLQTAHRPLGTEGH